MKIAILFTLLLSATAHADLLARMNLEEAFRQRLETVVKTYDPEGRVLIRFDYRNVQGVLPGTSLSASEQMPSQVDVSDISRANIEIYTVNVDLPEDFNKTVFKILPIPKEVIAVQKRKLDIQKDAQIVKEIDAKSLNEIATQSVNSLTEKMIYLFSSLMALIFLGFAYISQRRMKDFKLQMSLLTSAVAESVTSANAASFSAHASQNRPQTSASAEGLQFKINSLHGLSDETLLAVLSDCYWCAQDTEASWMWRRLDSKRKFSLMGQSDFLKSYSHYLQNITEQESTIYEDSYYYQPQNYSHLNNEDLAACVQKNPSLWHNLSPLRQKYLPISIDQKLQIRISLPDSKSFDFAKLQRSASRSLEVSASVTHISSDDELKILSDPNIVPMDLRSQVPTLVWLAQKDTETITKILAKYDARSLASAWIAPEETLRKLEACLPEKKAKVLRSYLTKSSPDRTSDAFKSLYLEGLHDDVA